MSFWQLRKPLSRRTVLKQMTTVSISFTQSIATLLRAVFLLLVLGGLVSCGGGSSSDDPNPAESPDALSDLDEPLPETEEESENTADPLTNNGVLLPVIFETQTDLDLEYARDGMDLISQLSTSLILPADIDVIFADCGTANAFFVPPSFSSATISQQEGLPQSPGGSVFMCHELTQLFSDFYSDKDQAVSASIFVLMHEIGHALVNQLELPVLGIEESYVDGVSAVFLGEAGLSIGTVLAGWFFGSQSDTPFFDSHRAGPQRLGDLACWGVGADITLIEDPIIANITQQLITGGRNCQAEYNQQLNALNIVLGPYLIGDLSTIFGNTDTL